MHLVINTPVSRVKDSPFHFEVKFLDKSFFFCSQILNLLAIFFINNKELNTNDNFHRKLYFFKFTMHEIQQYQLVLDEL